MQFFLKTTEKKPQTFLNLRLLKLFILFLYYAIYMHSP